MSLNNSYPEFTFNDNSYGTGAAFSLTINGSRPIVTQSPFVGNNGILSFSFTRAGLGVNGSSILGVA
jgi:hypothetical protein